MRIVMWGVQARSRESHYAGVSIRKKWAEEIRQSTVACRIIPLCKCVQKPVKQLYTVNCAFLA